VPSGVTTVTVKLFSEAPQDAREKTIPTQRTAQSAKAISLFFMFPSTPHRRGFFIFRFYSITIQEKNQPFPKNFTFIFRAAQDRRGYAARPQTAKNYSQTRHGEAIDNGESL
jgi:hypothetical protein